MEKIRTGYKSDIKNTEYEEIKHLIEAPKHLRGREKYTPRSKLNALFYILDNGAKYRSLPNDFPPFRTVFAFKKKLEIKGILDKILEQVKKKSIFPSR